MQVLYGLDYVAQEQQQQLQHVRDALIAHVRDSPEPLVVVEEYDKLDCATRAFFRQLLQHPELTNTTFNRRAAAARGCAAWAGTSGQLCGLRLTDPPASAAGPS